MVRHLRRIVGVLGVFALLSLAVPLPHVDEVRNVDAAQSSLCDKNPKPANLNFVLKDSAGKDFDLAAQKGKVISSTSGRTWFRPARSRSVVRRISGEVRSQGHRLGVSVDDRRRR